MGEKMDDYLDKLLDEVDAVVFSGDRLHDFKTLDEFRSYLQRWEREIKNIEDLLRRDRNE